MEALIKIKIICFIVLTLGFSSIGQQKNCSPLRILVNIEHETFSMNDTIKIVLQNTSDSSIQYHMDVMMCQKGSWSYSPYYTRYFNHDLSYTQLRNILNSKLPITFPPNYKHPASTINPSESKSLSFIIDEGESQKELIRFRFNVINGKEGCKMTYSNAFYFRKIKEK